MKDTNKKPLRYESRDTIETIIKENNIDRARFHEYSKAGYSKIINSFYYAFIDHGSKKEIDLNYCWLRFRKDLKQTDTVSENIGWANMLLTVSDKLDDRSEKYYLILKDGWVYEGYIDEIISVLTALDGMIDDFYIVTADFDKCISYCEDGECMWITEK